MYDELEREDSGGGATALGSGLCFQMQCLTDKVLPNPKQKKWIENFNRICSFASLSLIIEQSKSLDR